MNEYEYRFTAKCPNNQTAILYNLRLLSSVTVMVEAIIDACRFDDAFHEDIADLLYTRLGGKQIITALHDSVKIKTKRGF